MTKVVNVFTSATELNGLTTGAWIDGIATLYHTFLGKGCEVVLASSKGGPIPIDMGSLSDDYFTDVGKKFLYAFIVVGALPHSAAFGSVDFSSGVDAIYVTGGLGASAGAPEGEFVDQTSLSAVIEAMYHDEKVFVAVCRGDISLIDYKDGEFSFLDGKKVTAFTYSKEESLVDSLTENWKLTRFELFHIETRYIKQGADFEKSEDWKSKVYVDEKLVTGLN